MRHWTTSPVRAIWARPDHETPRLPPRHRSRAAPGRAAPGTPRPDEPADAGRFLGPRRRAPPPAHRQRQADPHQGLVRRAPGGPAAAPRGQAVHARPHDGHQRRVLAIPRHESGARPHVHAQPRRRRRHAPVRAVDARDLPGPGRAAGKTACALLHLRWRPRGPHFPAGGDAQSHPQARPVVQAGRGGGQRRPRLLGPALAAHGEGLGRRLSQSETTRPGHLRPKQCRAGHRQRGAPQKGRGPADRAGLRHRLPLDADVLHPGRPRLF